MYILYNKYVIGLFLCIFIPLHSFTQELGLSFNYNRTTMLSDLQFNEKIDVSFSPSISINFTFTNTRLDLIYGSNEFTRSNYTFNAVTENSENDLYDVNLNMSNSFISLNVNQQVFSFNRAKFLVGSGLTYGKVNFFRNLYNNQGFPYAIVDGNYTINNQLVSLDDNFETKIGSDSYYGINFNSEIDFMMDDKLFFIAGVDYVYNLSDNLDLRKETFDYNKQNDRFYSIKLGVRYLIGNTSSKSSGIKKIDSQISFSNSNSEEIQQSFNDDQNTFTLNIPATFSSEMDTNLTSLQTEDIQLEEKLLPTPNNNCIYFIVDTLNSNSSTRVITFKDKPYYSLYCTESLIDALAFMKSNNIQNAKIINIENDLISEEHMLNESNHSASINTIKDIDEDSGKGFNSKKSSFVQGVPSKTKKMYLDKDVDSLEVTASPTFFVIVGVFSSENNALNFLKIHEIDIDNSFVRNDLFYAYSFKSIKKLDAIKHRGELKLESWIYELK